MEIIGSPSVADPAGSDILPSTLDAELSAAGRAVIREFAGELDKLQLCAILQQAGVPTTAVTGETLSDDALRARVRRLTLTLEKHHQESLVLHLTVSLVALAHCHYVPPSFRC